MTDSPFSKEQIETARRIFAGPVAFAKGVVDLDGLPPGDRPEFAFAGRSNVGKSSLINALCNRKNLARASNTPGRTQEINFFDFAEGRFWMVDLPGYGFANAPKKSVDAWNRMTMNYLRNRSKLKRVFMLVDSRRGLGDVDFAVMEQLNSAAVAYQIVLTKSDKIKPSDLAETLAGTVETLKQNPSAHPRVLATSSEKGRGIPELRAEIIALAPPPEKG